MKRMRSKKEQEGNWRSRISVGPQFEQHLRELLKRLEKFESMWDGHLDTIHET